MGPGPRDLQTWDPGPLQSLKVGPQDPLQSLKVVPQDPPQSLKLGPPEFIFLRIFHLFLLT